MDEKIEQIEQIRLPDGRYGERRTIDDYDFESGLGEKVVEKYEEPERKVNLQERITEKRRPCVYERKFETIKDNEVVDVKIESLDPMTKMELREHIALASSVKKQSENNCDCYVTKEELKEAMVAAAEEIRNAPTNIVQTRNVAKPKVRFQNIVEEEIEEEEEWNWVEWALLAVVGLQAAWLIVNVLPRYLGA